MDERERTLLAVVATGLVFALVQVGGLSLLEPFEAAGYQPVEDPSNPANSILYFLGIMVATGIMLAAIRLEILGAIRALVVFTAGLLAWYALSVWLPTVVSVGGVDPFAAGGALALGVALWVYPEWYVIDVAGIVMGAAAAALFGLAFGLLPAIVLLVALAVYDAVSVYGTEHMLTLAGGAMEMRVPVLFVIPTTPGFSFLEETAAADDSGSDAAEGDDSGSGEAADGDGPGSGDVGPGDPSDDGGRAPETDDGEELVSAGALFVGLGDAIMPSIMVTSAALYADAPAFGLPWVVLNLPALGAMLGTMAGLAALLWLVLKGRPHAGLPLLNGGAIAGYLLGAVASGIPLLRAVGI